MAQIKTKFLEDSAVSTDKIANGAITSAKLNATLDLPSGATRNGNAILDAADKGVAGGVATLDGGGKVPVAQLPSAVMTYEGVWNASTNTPTLADGTGDAGQVYRVSVAGSQNLGSGSISFDVGDYAIHNGSTWEKSDTTDAVASVNGFTGVVSLDTDDISEGGSNLYHTVSRARTAAVINSTAGTETDQAASVAAMKSYVTTQVAAVQAADAENEVITLIAGDITNQYVDLNFQALPDSVKLYASGLKQLQGTDYTLNYTGGSGGVTRVTFAGDLATGGDAALVAADVIEINYLRD